MRFPPFRSLLGDARAPTAAGAARVSFAFWGLVLLATVVDGATGVGGRGKSDEASTSQLSMLLPPLILASKELIAWG